MRRFSILAGCSFALVASAGCGDSSVAGGGGEGGLFIAEGGKGGAGAGGAGGCVQMTGVLEFMPASEVVFVGTPDPPLGDPIDEDLFQLRLADDATGTIDLETPANSSDCKNGLVSCVVVFQDAPLGAQAAATYFATEGTLELGATSPPYFISGGLSAVKFSEVDIDPLTGDVSVPEGGRCLELASLSFDIARPTPNWTCDPSFYDETGNRLTDPYCDCACGDVDPDCSVTGLPLDGCFDGQMCGATGECEGTPTEWTCPPDQFDGGAGNGCDCNCGTPDPDCALPGEAVEGCAPTDSCGLGVCVPMDWACPPEFYDSGMMGDCDCGCGIADPDCASAAASACDYCDDVGSCNSADCPGSISATDNATCS